MGRPTGRPDDGGHPQSGDSKPAPFGVRCGGVSPEKPALGLLFHAFGFGSLLLGPNSLKSWHPDALLMVRVVAL